MGVLLTLLLTLLVVTPALAADPDAPRLDAAAETLRQRLAPRELVVGLAEGAIERPLDEVAQAPGAAPKARRLLGSLADLGVSRVTPVFRRSVDPGATAEAAARKARRDPASPLARVYTLRFAAGADLAAAERRLAADPAVAWVEPNGVFLLSAELPDDPHVDGAAPGGPAGQAGDERWNAGAWGQGYPDLWGLDEVGWGEVWARRQGLWPEPAREGGGEVILAVIDSGVDTAHPDLAGRFWQGPGGAPGADFVDVDPEELRARGFGLVEGEDYTEPDDQPDDLFGHGTHVAGIAGAAADNGEGIAGVAWGARIMAVRIGYALDLPNGARTGALEHDDAAAGIVWAVDQGARVLNLSFGGPEDPRVLRLAIEHAVARGALPVAAAGNRGVAASGESPARLPGVLSVATHGPDDVNPSWSNWGPTVDLSAPGIDTLSLRARRTTLTSGGNLVGSDLIRASGTSMAAPHVAGVAALVLSRAPELAGPDGGMDLAELTGRLLGTARPRLPLGTGRLDGAGTLWANGVGGLDALAALTADPAPRLALLSRSVDAVELPGTSDGDGSDGDGRAEAGETVPLDLTLAQVWRPVEGVTLTAEALDPELEVLSLEVGDGTAGGSPTLGRWAFGQEVPVRLRVAVSPGAQQGRRARIRLTATGTFQGPEGPEVAVQSLEIPLDLVGAPRPPALTSPAFPDFRFFVRILDEEGRPRGARAEAGCIAEALCVSGAVPGRVELILRIIGPRPNGRLWPVLVRLTPSRVEVEIEQISTGLVERYDLDAIAPGDPSLDGLLDREGFPP